MTRSLRLLAGAVCIAAAVGGQGHAQGVQQSAALTQVDPASLATGYRTSKVVGSTVYNEANDTIGTIDDLIVTPADKVPYVVVSVGGFFNLGTRYVVVPYSAFARKDKHMILLGATKASLKALPEFKYAT